MNTENSNQSTDLGSNFPEKVRDRLHRTLADTPHGCGGCVHAEWIDRDLKEFVVGVCRFGIKLQHVSLNDAENQKNWSLAGHTPVDFCTAQNAKI